MPEQKIEIDVKQTQSKLAKGMDINEILFNTQAELEEELSEADSTLNLAALGAQYSIGPLDICITLGNLVLLQQHVPEILEVKDEMSFDTCVKTLYVLAKGKEAIAPLMEIEQRIKDMYMLKNVIKDNPSLFKELMDRVEIISQSRVIFLDKARDFYFEYFVLDDFPGILNKCIQVIDDAFTASSDIAVIEDKNQIKKKV